MSEENSVFEEIIEKCFDRAIKNRNDNDIIKEFGKLKQKAVCLEVINDILNEIPHHVRGDFWYSSFENAILTVIGRLNKRLSEIELEITKEKK